MAYMHIRKWSIWFAGILGVLVLIFVAANIIADIAAKQDLADDEASPEAFKIQVVESGIYKVSLDDLQKVDGTIASMSLESLNLTEAGVQIPYIIDGQELIFYGSAPESRFTPYRTYLLRMNEPGLAIQSRAVPESNSPISSNTVRSLHLEENHIYDSRSVREWKADLSLIDPWYWATIQNDEELNIEFNASSVDTQRPATLRIALYGVTSSGQDENDHDVRLWLNGAFADSASWDGETHTVIESVLQPGMLQSGNNTLLIDNLQVSPGSEGEVSTALGTLSSFALDIIRLDWIEVDYRSMTEELEGQFRFQTLDGNVLLDGLSNRSRLIDITDVNAPVELTGGALEVQRFSANLGSASTLVVVGENGYKKPLSIRPLRSSAWRARTNQADLVIITTENLSPSLAKLADWRRQQGLSVALVSVEDIYDQFGYGEALPESIKTFIQYTLTSWADPSPAYLLIVGEASYDYNNYLGGPTLNVIPAPMVPVEYGGETVSDARLADIDLDGLPDIAVGRWPVDSAAEVSKLVERTIAYEEGDAIDRVILAADGTSKEFEDLSEEVLRGSELTSGSIERLYGATSDQFTDSWNQGAWLVSYVGHGSIDRWGKDDVFSHEAVPDLRTDGSPPIVLQLTCLTAFFAHPTVDSISELMLRHDNGPVVIVAATSLTLSSSQRPFGENFIRALQDNDILRVGDALQRAKMELDVEGSQDLREISETFTLLGDPSTLIVKPS